MARNWAEHAAHRILLEYKHKSPYWLGQSHDESDVAAIILTHAAPLMALLREAKREHTDKCMIGVNPDPYTKSLSLLECDCGADAWNKRVDDTLNGS